MLAELMVAAKGLSSVKNVSKGGNFHGGSIHAGGSNSFSNASLFSGGLAGAVGRQFTQSAVQTVTGQKSNPISCFLHPWLSATGCSPTAVSLTGCRHP